MTISGESLVPNDAGAYCLEIRRLRSGARRPNEKGAEASTHGRSARHEGRHANDATSPHEMHHDGGANGRRGPWRRAVARCGRGRDARPSGATRPTRTPRSHSASWRRATSRRRIPASRSRSPGTRRTRCSPRSRRRCRPARARTSSMSSRTRPNTSTAGYLVPLDDLVELEQHRALGAQGLDPRRQDLRRAAGGLYQRALLQQGHAEEARRRRCRRMASSRQAQFLDLVKKAKAAGMTPIAQGVGDRPFPGAYIVGEALLRKLGKDDYQQALHRQAVASPTRASSRFSNGSRSWSTPAPIRRTS